MPGGGLSWCTGVPKLVLKIKFIQLFIQLCEQIVFRDLDLENDHITIPYIGRMHCVTSLFEAGEGGGSTNPNGLEWVRVRFLLHVIAQVKVIRRMF